VKPEEKTRNEKIYAEQKRETQQKRAERNPGRNPENPERVVVQCSVQEKRAVRERRNARESMQLKEKQNGRKR